MIPLLRVHHVALIVSDYEQSKKFYTQTLGFEILAENYREDRQSYKLDVAVPGGVQLEIFSFPDSPARPSQPEARGLRHLCFATGDWDYTLKALREAGIDYEPERVDPYTGKRFTFFRDPDDLPLEVYEVAVIWKCPTCGQGLTQMAACGSVQYFCDHCRSLVSRSKRIAD